MEKTSGLGRGLSSLIPSKKDRFTTPLAVSSVNISKIIPTDESRERVVELPVEKVSANPYQPRTGFNEEEISELKESIREHGLIQPIIVTRHGEGWQIIAGERRWRAIKSLGFKTIPAIVRNISDQKKLEVALIENLQRKDLNGLETAMAYQKLVDEFSLTYDQLAKRVGKSKSSVANTIRILNTINEVKEAINAGRISEGHARTLASLPQEDQRVLLGKILADGLNVREAEKESQAVVVKKHIRNIHIDPEVRAKTEELQRALGTKVEIKKSGESGQIIIKFYSGEELGEIVKKITGNK